MPTTAPDNSVLCGVVEGFYGPAWSWAARESYAGFLKSTGLNAYLYCPKSDAHLRKRWQEPWPRDTAAALSRMAAHYRDEGLSWGVGLSPFALYESYTDEARSSLRERLREIDAIGGNILAILFDDMPGDCPDLAARQAEIVADISAWTAADRLLVCPTYYSTDPVLEQHFGARPPDYWSDLGDLLAPDIDLFWTGPRVCSQTIAAADLQAITAAFRRPPVLWDNYPVNDGANACKYLHITPLPGRSRDLVDAVRGHFCNPMNQAELSRYPLTGLSSLHFGGSVSLADLYPAALAAMLERDLTLFEQCGLDGMSGEQRESIAAEYSGVDHPAAREVCAWLRGDYAFDPACLTG